MNWNYDMHRTYAAEMERRARRQNKSETSSNQADNSKRSRKRR